MRKSYAGAADKVQTVVAISATSPANGEDLFVSSVVGYPSSGYFVIALGRQRVLADGTSAEEKVLVSPGADVDHPSFILHPTLGRGYDDTVAKDHPVGEIVEHVLDAATLTEFSAYIYGAHSGGDGLWTLSGDGDLEPGEDINSFYVGPNGPATIDSISDFDDTIVSGQVGAYNEKWALAITGSPTGGTFDLTFKRADGLFPTYAFTDEIIYPASAADIRDAMLAADNSLTINDIRVTEENPINDPHNLFYIEYVGANAHKAINGLFDFYGSDSLTGGSGPSIITQRLHVGKAADDNGARFSVSNDGSLMWSLSDQANPWDRSFLRFKAQYGNMSLIFSQDNPGLYMQDEIPANGSSIEFIRNDGYNINTQTYDYTSSFSEIVLQAASHVGSGSLFLGIQAPEVFGGGHTRPIASVQGGTCPLVIYTNGGPSAPVYLGGGNESGGTPVSPIIFDVMSSDPGTINKEQAVIWRSGTGDPQLKMKDTAGTIVNFPLTQNQTLNAQTGTTYTVASTDTGKLITLSNASAITLTVPQDSSVTFAIGSWCELFQLGAGQITVVAGAGATLRTTPTAKSRAQYSRLFLQKISANTWSLAGDIAAS